MKFSALGYTLIELLVVISIMALLSFAGFVNFKGFSSDQVTIKAAGQIQTLLRLARSNATSSTLCNGSVATSWYLNFISSTAIYLNCNPGGTTRRYDLENAQLSITGDSGCSIPLAAAVSYSPGVGKQTFSSDDDTVATRNCLNSPIITFTVSNTINPSASSKSFNISKGGAVDVQ